MRTLAATIISLAYAALLPGCGGASRIDVQNEIEVPIVVEVLKSVPVYGPSVTQEDYKKVGERDESFMRCDIAAGGTLVAIAKLDLATPSPWKLRISSREHTLLEAPIHRHELPLRLSVRREQGELKVVPVKR